MKRKMLLSIVSMLLIMVLPVKAQQYEWVRNFNTSNDIVASITDNQGNLYILGNCKGSTLWNGGNPIVPDLGIDGQENINYVLIAKISSDGDMVWHKVITGSSRTATPHDIKPMGSNAFTCLITMPLATVDDYLYYLDTMIYPGRHGWDYSTTPYSGLPWPDYPISAQYLTNPICLALITFDFNGHVQEQHFLQMSYLDANGEDILYRIPAGLGADTTPRIESHEIMNPTFAIMEDAGNSYNKKGRKIETPPSTIYLAHLTYNIASEGPVNPYYNYTVEEGTISAVKYWCDGQEVGVVPIDSTQAFVPQILKFPQHFDTLLGSRFVFQNKVDGNISFWPNYLQTDRRNTLYYIGNVTKSRGGQYSFAIDSSAGFYVHCEPYNTRKGFLVRYDENLSAIAAVSLEDSIIGYDDTISNTLFLDIVFDHDSNLMFLSAETGRTYYGDTAYSFTTVQRCQGTPLLGLKNDAFFMSFKTDVDSLPLYSYGSVDSRHHSQIWLTDHLFCKNNHLACKNNRLFMQVLVDGGVRFPGQDIVFPTWGMNGRCITIFDYQGNVIGGLYYDDEYGNAIGSPLSMIALSDSALYFADRVISSCTIGGTEITTPSTFIAKYIDSAFMNPATVQVEVVEENLSVVRYPNPTTGLLTIDMNGRPLREAWVAAVDGIAEPLPVTPLGGDRYAADLTGRPAGTYILVLVVDDRHVYHCQVILQR